MLFCREWLLILLILWCLFFFVWYVRSDIKFLYGILLIFINILKKYLLLLIIENNDVSVNRMVVIFIMFLIKLRIFDDLKK